MREINKVIVHCSATRPCMDINSNDIRQWHKARGWSDIGYHFVILRSGVIEAGRPIMRAGAHCRGHNLDSIGVCLIGGVNDDNKPEFNYTYKQMRALKDLLVSQMRRGRDIYGHNEFSSKACPCFNVREFMNI